MQSLISDELTTSLHEQIGVELQNANIYLFIEGFFRNKGLNNLAKHFQEQVEEEHGHAKLIVDLLTDLNAEVKIPEISACEMSFGSILDVANIYVEREVSTTESLDGIKKLAIEEGNPIVEECMRLMIKLQQNEYSEATDFSDKAELVGKDWMNVFIWDSSLR